jgi:hypothetical protein
VDHRPSRRALLALGAGVACTVVALAGAPVAAAGSGATPTPIPTTSPSPSPSATPGDDDVDEVPPDPLEVTIERLTPSSLPTRGERGEVRVRGTVTNRSADEWRDLSVYLVTSQEPITSKAELAAAAATDPRAEVATRIVEPGLFVEVRDLRPGERTGFRLAVPTDQLGISGEPGVYWLGVQVLASSDLGRDASADGRARTFLPLVPERNDGTELALAMQIRNHTVRSFDGRLEYLEGWQATLAEGGRLRRLLDLSATATSDQELSWVVDPALVDSALSVTRGNPALEMAPPAEGGAGGDGSSGEDGDEPTPEQAAADQWLSDFFAAARVRSVMTLPYGDLDVSAVLRHGVSDLLTTAFGSSTQLLAENGVSASPVLLPPSGLLSPSAVAELDPGLPLVLAPEALVDTSPEPLLNRADGGRILVAPIPDDMWGPEPGSRSALAVRQRLLADAALHTLSPARDEPVVRFLPPGWDPGDHWRRAMFFRGLDVPWLSPVDVRDVLDRLSTAPAVDPAENVGYPDAELEAELPLPTVLSTEALIAEGSTVEELVTDDSDVDEQVIRQALLTSSFWSRARPGLAAERAVAARDRVAGWLDEVTVRGPAFVTMSSENGTFQVTVVNGLDQRVTVGLRASVTGGDLQLSTPDPVELAPHSRGAMRIDASSTGIGVHQVTLQPVSTKGTPLGQPTTVSIRSSRVGFILWIVMAVGGTALFVAIVLRIWRRVRRRRRTHGPVLKQVAS